MKNKKDEKIYSDKDMVKAMYEAILKNVKYSQYKDDAQAVVDDILDPNYEAQVDPDEIPSKKPKVMNKAKGGEKATRKISALREHIKRKKLTGNKYTSEKGVHTASERKAKRTKRGFGPGEDVKGKSHMGHAVRQGITDPKLDAKGQSKRNLQELKDMPKPDLPKSEDSTNDMQKAKGAEKERRKGLASKAHGKKFKEQQRTGTLKDGSKYTYRDNPNAGHSYGVNKPFPRSKGPGESRQGHKVRNPGKWFSSAKEDAKDTLEHLKRAPKPDLPKSEKGIDKLKKFQQKCAYKSLKKGEK